MVSCPLCCQSSFPTIDLLRANLISVKNRPLICPICNVVLHGLNTFATHLSEHIEQVPVPSQIDYSVQQSSIDHHLTCSDDVNNVIHNVNSISTNFRSATEYNFNENENDAKQMHIFGPAITDTANEMPTNKLISPTALSMTFETPAIIPTTTIDSTVTMQPTVDDDVVLPTKTNNRLDAPFMCHLCACSFRSLELQQLHLQLVHEIFTCRSFDTNENKLADSSTANMLQCHLCPKRFKMNGSLRLHVRMVHGVPHVSPQKIRGTTKTSTATVAAINKNTPNVVQSIANNSQNKIRTGDPSPTSLLSLMDQTKENSTNLQHANNNQINYYSNYANVATMFSQNDDSLASSLCNVDNTNETYNKNQEAPPIMGTDERVHECDICSKRFTTKYFLKKHKRLHTGKCVEMKIRPTT